MKIISTVLIVATFTVMGTLIIMNEFYTRNTQIEKLSSRVNVQADMIRDMTVIVSAYDELIIKHEQLQRELTLVTSLSPLKDIVTVDEVSEFLKDVPHGNPFKTDYLVTESFGLSEGLFHIVRFSHQGTDMIPIVPENMDWDITPFSKGKVIAIGFDELYGKNIIIEHSDRIRTRYAHLDKIFYSASVGTIVNSNTTIGVMGSTGQSSSAHLHLELLIWNGEYWVPINIEPFLDGTKRETTTG